MSLRMLNLLKPKKNSSPKLKEQPEPTPPPPTNASEPKFVHKPSKVPKYPNSKWFSKKLPQNPEDLPKFVLDAMEFVEEFGIHSEGIFRISANKENEAQAIEELEKSPTGEIKFIDYDVHVAANILKLFFRELPEPLLTYENYGMFIAASGIPESEARGIMIKRVLQFLPPSNQRILKYLSLFLFTIAENNAMNRMNSENLAIVFAPNLLQSNLPQTVSEVMSETKHSNTLMQTLIQEAELIFGPRERKKKLVEDVDTVERMSRIFRDDEFNNMKNSYKQESSVSALSAVDYSNTTRKKSLTRKPVGMKRWSRKRNGSNSKDKNNEDDKNDEEHDTATPWSTSEITGTTPRSSSYEDAEEDSSEAWEEDHSD